MDPETDAVEPAARTDEDAAQHSELISRLRVIESQPLRERAAAYAALHEELARQLESGPVSRPHE